MLLDGERPISARVRRIGAPVLRLRAEQHGCEAIDICVTTLTGLEDYCRPAAPCALLKAAVVAFGLVGEGTLSTAGTSGRGGRSRSRSGGDGGAAAPSPSPRVAATEGDEGGGPSLADALLNGPAASGLEIATRSELPTGSGMGTSSILAGALLSALGAAVGKRVGGASLVHLVLRVEQMMTTGGGWQDQVGGLLPGAKIARSAAALPLRVATAPIALPAGFAATLSRRLLLVFTGRQRLARNLLMDVLRRWAARPPEITRTVRALTANAEACAVALAEGDAERVGACLAKYWAHKVAMAPGCEPEFVRAMMHALAPLTAGQALCGAGGGGFLVALLHDGASHADARTALDAAGALGPAGGGASDVSFHTATVDETGLQLTLGDDHEPL